MIGASRAVKGCPHRGFALERIPGEGYWAGCSDCGVAVHAARPTVALAMKDFEVAVKEAVAREEAGLR